MRKKTGVLKDVPRCPTDSQLCGMNPEQLSKKQRRRVAMRYARNHAIRSHSFTKGRVTSRVMSVKRAKTSWRLFYVTVEVTSKPKHEFQQAPVPDRSIHWYEVHKNLNGKVSPAKPA